MTTGTYEVRTARRWQRQLCVSFPAALALVRYNNRAREQTIQHQRLLDWASSTATCFAAYFWESRYEEVVAIPGDVRSVMQCFLYDVVPDTARVAGLLPTVHDLFSNVHLIGREDASNIRLLFFWRKTQPVLRALVDCLPDIFELSNRVIDCLDADQGFPSDELAALSDRYVRLLSSATRSSEEFSEVLEQFVHGARPLRLYAPLTPWSYVHDAVGVMWHCSSRLERYAGYLLGEERIVPRRVMKPFPTCEDEDIAWY